MFVAYVVVTVLMVAVLLGSAAGKLTRQPKLVEAIESVGLSPDRLPQLATLEILGAVGLLVGFAVPLIGIAAAVGVVGYFIGAVFFHVRAGHTAEVTAPAILLLVAVIALVLRLATM